LIGQWRQADAASFHLLLKIVPVAVQKFVIAALQLCVHFHRAIAHLNIQRDMKIGTRFDHHVHRVIAEITQAKSVQYHEVLRPFQSANRAGHER
jgi:hypothetical protein